MASPVASSSPALAFMNTTGGFGTDTGKARETMADNSFSDVLRGQLRTGSTPVPARVDATTAARTPERPADAPAARQPERAPDRGNPRKTAAPERPHPDREAHASAPSTAAAEKDAAAVAKPQAGDKEKQTAASEGTDPDPESAAAESAVADVAAANDLAGLPAAIAALLPGLAVKQGPVTGDHAIPDGSAEDTDGIDLSAEMGLTGDTRDKSLQNPAGARSKLAPNPGLAGPQAQAITVLQAKAELSSGFAERAASALQAVAGEAPVGAQGSVMHALRHPGQLPATTPQLPVATPAGQSGWANEVGNRVMWMVGRAESKAELVLTPPNLGKVEVSINLNGDQTTAQFVAATQVARDALEQAMPRLRELLAQSGISLGQTGVSTSGEQQASGDGHTRGGGRGTDGSGIETGEAGVAAPWARQTEGLVDTFA